MIEKWINFLDNHRLTAKVMGQERQQVLARFLAATGEGPKWRPYPLRLVSRRLVCSVAMDAGIDLGAIRNRGRMAMDSGLLKEWNAVYTEKYGSNYGTSGWKERGRRNAKIATHKALDKEKQDAR